LWRARVSRCLAFFLVSLFSPDTGKYGDQVAIRNGYKHRGEDSRFCVLIQVSLISNPCTSETVSVMVLLVILGTGILIMKG
jgi:hypothetical protein